MAERIGLGLLLGGVAAPIAFSLVWALLYSLGLVGLLNDGFTTEHWQAVLSSRETWASVVLSTWVAAVTVVLTAGFALLITLGLRPALRRGPLSYLVFLPLAIPGTVAAFLTFQWFGGGGWVPRIAYALGLTSDTGELVSMVHDPIGLGMIVTHVAIAVPFFVLLFVQLYDTERLAELERLATALGAKKRQRVLRVTVPILLRGAMTNLVLFFIVVLGSFEVPWLLGRQSPQMLSVLTYRKFSLFDLGQKPEAFAVALVYTALVFGLLAVVFRRRRYA
ncbi:MAG: ABC transporter permease subunit [Acidobacteriota bacterium]